MTKMEMSLHGGQIGMIQKYLHLPLFQTIHPHHLLSNLLLPVLANPLLKSAVQPKHSLLLIMTKTGMNFPIILQAFGKSAQTGNQSQIPLSRIMIWRTPQSYDLNSLATIHIQAKYYWLKILPQILKPHQRQKYLHCKGGMKYGINTRPAPETP